MAYQSPYTNKKKVLLEDIENVTPFNYNAEADPAFQSYKKQYGELGDRALTNTMSEFSSLTGGRPSSWAVSAGEQAKSNFDTQLMDKVPQLQQMAYAMYNDNLNNKRSNFSMYDNLDNQEYGRYNDQLNYDYKVGRDNVSDTQWQKQFDNSNNQWWTNYNNSNSQWQKEYDLSQKSLNSDGSPKYGTGSVSNQNAPQNTEAYDNDEYIKRIEDLDKQAALSATGWMAKYNPETGANRDKIQPAIYDKYKPELARLIAEGEKQGLLTPKKADELAIKYGLM